MTGGHGTVKKLEGIANEILEQLQQLTRISPNDRQVGSPHCTCAILDGHTEIA